MTSLVMISPTVAVIAFVGHPLIQDSLNLNHNFHTPVGFAFVKIVVNSCYVVVPELVPEPVPATDAKQLKCMSH